MRINCPFCGIRDLHEFVYQGDAKARRPDAAASLSAEEERERYVDSIHFLDNPAGAHAGLWYHRHGCRNWLNITRDTRSHEILSVALVKPEPSP